MLSGRYPRAVCFVVNGTRLEKQGWSGQDVAPIAVRLARKRKPAAAGYMVRDHLPIPEERRGIAVSTFGKVIKRGWDWLGVTPGAAEHVGGLIEVPDLAECLTLNKADFVRGGPRGATYLAYRKAVQEAVSRQLALWGDARDAGEPARPRGPARRARSRSCADRARRRISAAHDARGAARGRSATAPRRQAGCRSRRWPRARDVAGGVSVDLSA